jgi:hypothetical protein
MLNVLDRHFRIGKEIKDIRKNVEHLAVLSGTLRAVFFVVGY